MAKIAVAVLMLIAIAGVVLATLQRRLPDEGPVAADSTQPASAPMTEAAAAAAAAQAEGLGNQVVFAPDSAQLTSGAKAKLLRLAEKATKEKQRLTLVGKVDTHAKDKEQRRLLARKRAIAVRGALEENGVPLSSMETMIEEPPFGLTSPKQANEIEVNPR